MTVSLSGMVSPLHSSKRLPTPAVHSYSAPAPKPLPVPSKHRFRRCSPRLARLSRPPAIYRALTVLLFLATLVFLLAHYPLRTPTKPPLSALDFRASFQHSRKLARRTVRLYQRQLHLHPLLSRAITAGIIFFIADLLAQLLKRRNSGKIPTSLSAPRLLRYSIYGLVIMGPFLYLWYAVMNEYGPEDDLKGSLLKCIFEQLTLEPICVSMYIIYDGIVCRRGTRATRRALDAQFFPLWFKNAVFWLPANFANYYIGTPELRVIFANLCSLFWNIYFSSKVNISVSSLTADRNPKNPKHLPLSNHDREAEVLSSAGAYPKPSDPLRRPGDALSSPRIPPLLV